MRAIENKNILTFLNKMKSIIDCINSMKSKFKISDLTYAQVIAQFLNSSWDQWLENNIEADLAADESEHTFSVVHFQCKLKDKYYRKNSCKEDEALHGTHQANISVTQPNRIFDNNPPTICKNCNRHWHATDDCWRLGKLKCNNCNQFRHLTKECYSTWMHKWDYESPSAQRGDVNKCVYKVCKNIQNSHVTENVDEESAIFIEEVISLPASESHKEDEKLSLIDNSNIEDLVNYSEFKKTFISDYIMCLVDSGTTSHIFRDDCLFLNYWPIENMYVGGVEETWSCVKGKGTVILIATYRTQKTKIKLQDVIYVPDARHNLISLRRWENENRPYHTQKGILTLYSSQGNAAIQGERVYNNLYWLRFQTNADTNELPEHAFPTLPWKEWHRRYSHISYTRLQSLKDKNLVNRFNPDPKFPKWDCGPCTAAKMHHKAFSPTAT